MVALVHGLAGKVARHDANLARQMKNSSSSSALNASEGVWARAGKRGSRLKDAVNEARNTLVALRLAARLAALRLAARLAALTNAG